MSIDRSKIKLYSTSSTDPIELKLQLTQPNHDDESKLSNNDTIQISDRVVPSDRKSTVNFAFHLTQPMIDTFHPTSTNQLESKVRFNQLVRSNRTVDRNFNFTQTSSISKASPSPNLQNCSNHTGGGILSHQSIKLIKTAHHTWFPVCQSVRIIHNVKSE